MADERIPTRLYFDSNILRGWPNCSNEIWNILRLANWLKVKLFIPKIVEDELEAQFVRGVQALLDVLSSTVNQYRKLCRNIIQPDINGSAPTEKELQESFRIRSHEIKQHYSIATVPLTKLSLEVMVEMAIHRDPPFEQVQIDKNKNGVVGLQDAAILFSVMEHLPKTNERCILLTADKIFHHHETSSFIDQCGVSLERVRTAAELRDELSEHLYAAIREPWVKEHDAIEEDLNANKDELSRQLEELINTPGFDKDLWTRAKVREELRITEFRFIMTDLPEQRPPIGEYHREEGSKVPISARATAELDALVEPSFWDSVGMAFTGNQQITQTSSSLTDATLTEVLTVSLEGTVRNGRITDFIVTSVEPSKP